MRCPTLNELPPPPAGKTGWPWTEETPQLPPTMLDGAPWPKVSIVTPSFNQGPFIEETIRSVLLQGYPNLEYIVIDGGSTDETVEILRKYEPWLAYWVSEPDRGQSHAINKGFQKSNGEIIAWLNSDDIYLPKAFQQAALAFQQYPTAWMIYGDVQRCGETHLRLEASRRFELERYMLEVYICQPSSFQRRHALEAVGGVDESLFYCMDMDWWLRMATVQEPVYVPITFARFREWIGSKTFAPPAEKSFGEILVVCDRFFDRLNDDDKRRSSQKPVRAGVNLTAAICAFEQGSFSTGGQMIADAIMADRNSYLVRQMEVFDALLFSVVGAPEKTIRDSNLDLTQALEPLIRQELINRVAEKKLRDRLLVLKSGQRTLPDGKHAGRFALLRLALVDSLWLWRQRGWAKKAALGD